MRHFQILVVTPKGKGEMQTYWLQVTSSDKASSVKDTSSTHDSELLDEEDAQANGTVIDKKVICLIHWNAEVLLRLLKQIVANRQNDSRQSMKNFTAVEASFARTHGQAPIDEVQEIVKLPNFKNVSNLQEDVDDIVIHPVVMEQLKKFISHIASMYCDNPFHNFEHASHVAMSTVKLLSRIVAPATTELSTDIQDLSNPGAAATLHDHTYGITSDPLTQFSCALSALIHDVDHPGVPNAQLVLEATATAQKYNNHSVEEQNSVDLAWNLLMQPDYQELRQTIYSTQCELARFRQIVVNAVMATDIVDKELKAIRNMRFWHGVLVDVVIIGGGVQR